MTKRRKFGDPFMAKVALERLRGDNVRSPIYFANPRET